MDDALLDILVCPLCKKKVKHEDDKLVCHPCGLRYPVRDGIPVMIVEEAERCEGSESGIPRDRAQGE